MKKTKIDSLIVIVTLLLAGALSTTSAATVYVAEYGSNAIYVSDSAQGSSASQLATVTQPLDIKVEPATGNLLVTSYASGNRHQVLRYNRETGASMDTAVLTGTLPSGSYVCGISFDSLGRLYVTDYWGDWVNDAVLRYTYNPSTGKYVYDTTVAIGNNQGLCQTGWVTTGPGPTGNETMWTDSEGNGWVTATDLITGAWNRYYLGGGYHCCSEGLAISPNGKYIYLVNNYYLGGVGKMEIGVDTDFTVAYSSASLSSLAMDASANMYLTNTGGNKVKVLTGANSGSLTYSHDLVTNVTGPCGVAVYDPPADTAYYVATNGNDGWSGRLSVPNAGGTDGPFATLDRARNALRTLKSQGGLTSAVTVYLRAGTYFLNSTFVLWGQDSGTSTAPITYTAYPGEQVTISGGKRITGQWTNVGGNVWKCYVPETDTSTTQNAWFFRDLFKGDTRQPRSRWPNDEHLEAIPWNTQSWQLAYPTAGGFAAVSSYVELANPTRYWIGLDRTIPGGADGNLSSRNAELVSFNYWEINRAGITGSDSTHIQSDHRVGLANTWYSELCVGRRVFLEHAYEFIDQTGEWFLDSVTGLLYYQAASGEDPNNSQFIAPKLDQLVLLSGTTYSPVNEVHFENLQFEHATWKLPSFGYNAIQSGFYMDNATGVSYELPKAIECNYARNCSFVGCRMAHTGASGIGLREGCRYTNVVSCEFVDIGGIAIVIGDAGLSSATGEAVVRNLSVSHNTINGCATVHFGCVAIWQAFAPYVTISHNLILNMPYTGISAGWRWNDAPLDNQKNVAISHNEIRNVMNKLIDGGGIYTLGNQPSSTVSNNRIDGIPNGHGIYNDEGSSFITVEKNIVRWPGFNAYNLHYGHDLVVSNNVFSEAGNAYVERTRQEYQTMNVRFEKNICYVSRGQYIFSGLWTDGFYDIRNNLYYDPRGWSLPFPGNRSFAQWQAAGQDAGSQIADPRFFDPINGDFRLQQYSPAWAMGISEVDTSAIGPDITPPSGSVTINSGAAATNSAASTLALSASDNVNLWKMRFSNGNTNWSGWQSYSTYKSWNLVTGDGVKTVYVQFRDGAGNISQQCSDTIFLDTTPPIGSVSINSGSAYTTSTSVTLGLTADGTGSGLLYMRMSNDGITYTPWKPYASTFSWELSAGEGIRTVFAQFKDQAGNDSAICSDTIALGTPVSIGESKQRAPGSNVILSGMAVTAKFEDCIYVEETNRSAGIRVTGFAATAVCDMVDLAGSVTVSGSEKSISTLKLSVSGTADLKPLGLPNKSLGGSNFFFDPSLGMGQEGVSGSDGLNNMGLLIRCWGQFRYISSTSFTLNDGSKEIKCSAEGIPLDSSWQYALVEGISSCELDGTEVKPLLRSTRIVPLR